MVSLGIADHWGRPSPLPELVGNLYFLEISSVLALSLRHFASFVKHP